MLRRSNPGGVNKRRQTKGGNEVTSAALWADEKDWLVEVVIVEEGDEGYESLDYVGRLMGFAWVKNARVLAQVADTNPKFTAYELWFSFKFEANKIAFLNLVREDGYADPDEEDTLTPPSSLDDLALLRPVSSVFPKEAMDRINAVQIDTVSRTGSAGSR
jgi:hypothetical protein